MAKRNARDKVILDLGCGSRKVKGSIGVDFSKEKSDCDIEWDLEKFPYPFDKESVDHIFLREVLEHVYYPKEIIEECHRLLKKGGRLSISVPFLFPYHPDRHGYDYHRYTEDSLKRVLERFSEVEIEREAGRFLCAFMMIMPESISIIPRGNIWFLRIGKLLDRVFSLHRSRQYVISYRVEAVK